MQARKLPETESIVGYDSVTVERLSSSECDLWDAYVEQHPRASIYHRFAWSNLIHDTFGHESFMLCAKNASNSIVGVLPIVRLRSVLFGDFMVSMPYFNYGGTLFDEASVDVLLRTEAARLATSRGVSHLECRESEEKSTDWPKKTEKVSMICELPSDVDAWAKSLGAKLRSQTRRAGKEGALAVHGGSELLDDFYAVFSRNMRDLGTPVYPRRFFKAILSSYPDESRIHVVYLDGQPVAAGFLLGYRKVIEVPWASSLREFNRLSVNTMLYWEMTKFAIEQGYQRFDFGRSTRDAGTYRFKQQWGANPCPLYWYYWLADGGELPQLNPDNPKYKAVIAAWKKMPVALANIIGPRIVKYLP